MSHFATGPWPEYKMQPQQQQKKQQQQQQGEKKPSGEKKPAAEKKGEASDSAGPLELNPPPGYIQHRIALYEEFKKRRQSELEGKAKAPIKITLRDGKVIDGVAWETTPLSIAKGISSQFAEKVVVAKVNSAAWDMKRVLEGDCRIEFLDINDPEAQAVFWHSSAHILGEACERHYGCFLEHGPPTDEGFFYDMRMPSKEVTVSDRDFPTLDKLCKQITTEKQDFERLEMTKEELLEMFQYNDMKTYFIKEKIPDGSRSTVYRCGPLIDLCLGPHITNTNKVKALSVYRNASSYWLGKAENEVLQRVYGISFQDNKQMAEWQQWREEAKKRDHRLVGRNQELFFFHELSPGSCFFLPHGARIYNTLISFMRAEYVKRGFSEVISPNIYNVKLWERSGHWQNYQENMFSFEVENEKYALKPMNCPGHCVMFGIRTRSHRELPLRMADFGVLHRNELSGALTGLTRVRRFQQDDAHIFCAPEQINQEMDGALNFLKHVYSVLGFTLTMALSTRPEKFLGEIETWNKAEKQLEDALNKSGFEWKLNPGDGAFYGPKIDITISDAMKRRHQCATIQLDFQLPIRFDLKFQKPDGTEDRPVMIHRAILGSVERMIAILTENYAGKWPFWLSPRQVAVVPVAPPFYDYANKVQSILMDAGFHVDVDDSGDTMNKKIRNAQLAYYNFILVVGEKEQDENSVNIRTRDNVVHGTLSIEDTIAKFHKLVYTHSQTDDF